MGKVNFGKIYLNYNILLGFEDEAAVTSNNGRKYCIAFMVLTMDIKRWTFARWAYHKHKCLKR